MPKGTVNAQDYLLTAVGRLSLLLAWTWLALLHVAAALALLAALWWLLDPLQTALPIAQRALSSRLYGVLAAIGLPALFWLKPYRALLRGVASRIDRRIRQYLVSGLEDG